MMVKVADGFRVSNISNLIGSYSKDPLMAAQPTKQVQPLSCPISKWSSSDLAGGSDKGMAVIFKRAPFSTEREPHTYEARGHTSTSK